MEPTCLRAPERKVCEGHPARVPRNIARVRMASKEYSQPTQHRKGQTARTNCAGPRMYSTSVCSSLVPEEPKREHRHHWREPTRASYGKHEGARDRTKTWFSRPRADRNYPWKQSSKEPRLETFHSYRSGNLKIALEQSSAEPSGDRWGVNQNWFTSKPETAYFERILGLEPERGCHTV